MKKKKLVVFAYGFRVVPFYVSGGNVTHRELFIRFSPIIFHECLNER